MACPVENFVRVGEARSADSFEIDSNLEHVAVTCRALVVDFRPREDHARFVRRQSLQAKAP
jgi:hypothetical protein